MSSPSTTRIVLAGAIGNVLEWYDFAVYGYFAAAIGRAFFPKEDPVAQVLSAFGIFAVGYVMRPIGGAVVGHIGDHYGRRAALSFSVLAMAIPTFLVGVLPGYVTLGLMAPIALTALRMVQGMSVGGEYTTSIIFMVEQAPEGRRGLIGAMACCGAAGGILLGSATGAILANLMSAAALATPRKARPRATRGLGCSMRARQVLKTLSGKLSWPRKASSARRASPSWPLT